ncbi:peptidoglycan-binding protein [Streptomyces scabiei]|uniref:peptidoglycan-binding protein n=1 Tax=Streptomyces scabiei TaxID=1930 RepID=UPI0036E2AE0B
MARTDLSQEMELSGTLGYGTPLSVQGSASGSVTWLPAPGAKIERNEQLYRVDDRPVLVFYGRTPMFRRLDTRGLVGRDIKVVADNLRALGYDIGSQPGVGSTVRKAAAPTSTAESKPSPPKDAPTASEAQAGDAPGGPQDEPDAQPSAASAPEETKVKEGDGVLTASLMNAIRRWQTARGVAATGVLGAGDIVVTQGAVRVSSVKAKLGADATAGDLLALTATTKSVTVPVDATDVGSVEQGATVTIKLPDGSTAPGKVSGVATVVQSEEGPEGANGPARVTVTVSLDRAGADKVADIDSAAVQVQFNGQTKKDVLAVPVAALLALSEGGYAVQVENGPLRPVELGMFAKGMVEITGPSVEEGTKVVTAS